MPGELDAFNPREAARCRGRVIFFGFEQSAGIKAENIRVEGDGSRFDAVAGGWRYTFTLTVPGSHNVMNALAAIGVGKEMGLTDEEIAAGLAAASLTGMRLEIIEAGRLKIINDAYNANPASVKAALQTLMELLEKRTWLCWNHAGVCSGLAATGKLGNTARLSGFLVG